nr:uncharacterized protein LOC117277560 [Nicotiana tomentosiformis]
MPFRLKNAEATYQRLVTKMFKDQLGNTMDVYIDNTLVKSTRKEDQIDHLKEAFDILRRYGMKLNLEKCAFGVISRKFLGFPVQRLTGRIAALSRFISRSSEICQKFIGVLKKDNDLLWTSECVQALKELKAYLSSQSLLSKAELGERLVIYLAVSEVAVSAVLVREDKVTTFPLRNILHKPELSGRLAMWVIELSEHDIIYQPRTAIKSQVIVDFVADYSAKIMPEAEKEAAHAFPQTQDLWILYTDDASNASGSGLGLVLEVPTGEVIFHSIRCPDMTNNKAEYEVVIAGLRLALKYGLDQIPRAQNTEADGLAKLATTTKIITGEGNVVTLLHSSIDQIEKQEHSPRYANRKWPPSYGKTLCAVSASPKRLAATTDPNLLEKMSPNFLRSGISKEYSPPHTTLQKTLEEAKGLWPELLPEVLWAYRTTPKTSTGETPYSLVYGTDVVIPVEVGESSLRYSHESGPRNDESRKQELEEVEKWRDMAYIRMIAQKQQAEYYYNKKAKIRPLKVGDYVLKDKTQANKDPREGKLGTN